MVWSWWGFVNYWWNNFLISVEKEKNRKIDFS